MVSPPGGGHREGLFADRPPRDPDPAAGAAALSRPAALAAMIQSYCFAAGVAQLVRACGSYPQCPGFKSLHRHQSSHHKVRRQGRRLYLRDMPLIGRVRRTIRAARAASAAATACAVALSGGADSVALAARPRATLAGRRRCHARGRRPRQSRPARRGLGRGRGVLPRRSRPRSSCPFEAGAPTWPRWRGATRSSIEDAARVARYAFFDEAADRLGADGRRDRPHRRRSGRDVPAPAAARRRPARPRRHPAAARPHRPPAPRGRRADLRAYSTASDEPHSARTRRTRTCGFRAIAFGTS